MPNIASGLDELLSTHQTALRIREQRQALLASNIANADTPNYKARDVNFSAALKQALGSSTTGAQTESTQSLQPSPAPLPLAATSSVHLASKNSGGAGLAVQYRNDQQGRIDGNNVDMDYERMQFAENALQYEATVTLATGKIRGMLAVIQG